MFGREIPKQRGIYSEILTTEDTQNIKVSYHISNSHPASQKPFLLTISKGSVNFWSKQKVSLPR